MVYLLAPAALSYIIFKFFYLILSTYFQIDFRVWAWMLLWDVNIIIRHKTFKRRNAHGEIGIYKFFNSILAYILPSFNLNKPKPFLAQTCVLLLVNWLKSNEFSNMWLYVYEVFRVKVACVIFFNWQKKINFCI